MEGKADPAPAAEAAAATTPEAQPKRGKKPKGLYFQKTPPLPEGDGKPEAEPAEAAFYNIMGKEDSPPYRTGGDKT